MEVELGGMTGRQFSTCLSFLVALLEEIAATPESAGESLSATVVLLRRQCTNLCSGPRTIEVDEDEPEIEGISDRLFAAYLNQVAGMIATIAANDSEAEREDAPQKEIDLLKEDAARCAAE